MTSRFLRCYKNRICYLDNFDNFKPEVVHASTLTSATDVNKMFATKFAPRFCRINLLPTRYFHASSSKSMKICFCCQQQHRRPLTDHEVQDYNKIFRRSIDNPTEFWAEQADDLIWEKKWDKVVDNSNPPFTKW